MKNLLTSLFFLFALFSIKAQVQNIDSTQLDSTHTVLEFEKLEGLHYLSEKPHIVVTFPENEGKSIFVDAGETAFTTDKPLSIKGLNTGDHSLGLKDANGEEVGVSFKLRSNPPFIKSDAVVFGLLMFILFIIFKTTQAKSFKKFYKIVPALLLCYFVPAIFNSLNIISADESGLYYMASRYLLPASLVLLCLSIDLKGIRRLGPKALIMFFAATIGIVIGGPIALYLVSFIFPEVLDGEIWKGLSTVAGSWIGGGANQTAMKEIYGASDSLFSAMIVVDVFIANLFMAVLLIGTGFNKRLNKFFKADDSAIEELKTNMETYQASISKIPTFYDMVFMLGIAFAMVGLAHFLAGYIGPWIGGGLEAMKETSPNAANLMVSFGSTFFWLVVLATIFGVVLSFTKYRELEGVGASKFGSLFLYVLVATIGMKMNMVELYDNWQIFGPLIIIGLIWIIMHALILFIVAKIIKAPFFFVAVGSQANVGGAASAPIVASAFSPALAPVGVLLAVLGYAVGTFGAILCTLLMQGLTL